MTLLVTVRHIRQAGLCMAGARDWAASRNMDWRHFVDNGIPIEELEVLDDCFANRICALARAGEPK